MAVLTCWRDVTCPAEQERRGAKIARSIRESNGHCSCNERLITFDFRRPRLASLLDNLPDGLPRDAPIPPETRPWNRVVGLNKKGRVCVNVPTQLPPRNSRIPVLGAQNLHAAASNGGTARPSNSRTRSGKLRLSLHLLVVELGCRVPFPPVSKPLREGRSRQPDFRDRRCPDNSFGLSTLEGREVSVAGQ